MRSTLSDRQGALANKVCFPNRDAGGKIFVHISEGEMHNPWEKMDTKERMDSLKDEIADVLRQLATLTGTVGEIGGAVRNLEKAVARLKG